jgi:hypothetical protein
MEPRSDIDDEVSRGGGPSEAEVAGELADPVQGFQEDVPTEPELEPDDGYHPEVGGSKYAEADPVDEDLLAAQEGLDDDESGELVEEDRPG